MGEVLLLAFVFLLAGVVAVPFASRLGLGSVLGYLIAGIIISPLLAAFQVDVTSVQHFAEFGVVMMLFLVGLELEPRVLWEMRARLMGLGGLQVVLTTLGIMAAAMALGQTWSVALAIGLILATSSTAIVLQTLNEKGLIKSDGGQNSFAVLLFQDIAVIPMLAFLPLLALPELADGVAATVQNAVADGSVHGSGDHGQDGHAGGEHEAELNLISGLPGWQQAVVSACAIALVIVGGRYLTRPIFNFIAVTGLREIFVAAALLWVIGVALLMKTVGLSPALGTFLAGVVLANSEYRHELESNVEPFKGLLLGLFFITVGASINFVLLSETWLVTIGLAVGLILIKLIVLLGLSVLFNIGGANRWLFALALAQAGEFGFVLLSLSNEFAVIPRAVSDQLLLVVTFSMLLTPLLFILYDKVIAPRFVTEDVGEPEEDMVQGSIIIAGHGRFGGIVNRMLRGLGYDPTVVDYSSSQLEMLRTFDFRVYFGDATRPDLLHAAGIENARMLIVAIDTREQITELVRYVAQTYPHVHIIARAIDRGHVYELYAAGCRDIIRETFDSGVRAGRSAFEALGLHPYEAERRARQFVDFDKRSIRALADVYDPDVPLHENAAYVERALKIRAENDALLKGDEAAFSAGSNLGWAPPTLADVDAEKNRV